MSAALHFYSYNEDRKHMAFSSWSCHATKISSLLGLFLFLWLGGERDIMGASFRGIAVQYFSSCSVCARGPDSCVWDERPSETVWYCPWCNSLFCQRINVMMYSLPSLLMLWQPPDAGECVIVHFADKKAVKFVCCCLLDFCILCSTDKRELEAICVIWSFLTPTPGCVVAALGPNNQKAGSGSTICFVPLFPSSFWSASKSFLWSQWWWLGTLDIWKASH